MTQTARKFFFIGLAAFILISISHFLKSSPEALLDKNAEPYKLNIIDSTQSQCWSEFPGKVGVVVITDSHHWSKVQQLAKKLENNSFSKGLFVIDYTGQEDEFFRNINGQYGCYFLQRFNGSSYAMYPFTHVPAYYLIDDSMIAQGPFYKRKDILQKLSLPSR